MSAEAAAAFRDFLSGHLIVTIVVVPGHCKGLDEFPPLVPLRIDLSHAFSPPMWAEPSDAGLDFRASFSRVDRAVHVPWGALLSLQRAGRIPGTDSGKPPAQKAVAALDAPKPAGPVAVVKGQEGNVIAVDFATRKRVVR